jgi:calcineurin-like phosphoesterase family protein
MYWFTADEHYFHHRIIKYCNRPFKNIEEMNRTIIDNHNEVVKEDDIVIHAGDFSFRTSSDTLLIIEELNGKHIFLEGSHDIWLKKYKDWSWKNQKMYHKYYIRWEKKIENKLIVADHYAMRRWSQSHYNSWQLFGHSHGQTEPVGKQWDVGVDNNNFYPISFEQLKDIMSNRPNNENLVPQFESHTSKLTKGR